MHQKTFLAKDGQTYTLNLNETGEEIVVLLDREQVGVIDFQFSKGIQGAESYLITVLDLEKCKRKGIGEASLRFHQAVFRRPLRANGDIREGRQSQESQLTKEGSGFIGHMRAKGVIELIDFHGAFSEDE
ncbi:hypothetical protein [Methylophilus sp. OH31]|uniref:hypothetical protein n=1 Tax=Methylophilus sp. OH31 TaxID=1387312 RepID=UPI000463D60A|nr:hypothetical protein [Methylophilus sp. OH31]